MDWKYIYENRNEIMTSLRRETDQDIANGGGQEISRQVNRVGKKLSDFLDSQDMRDVNPVIVTLALDTTVLAAMHVLLSFKEN